MALSGVRSSWLILARNCDLCCSPRQARDPSPRSRGRAARSGSRARSGLRTFAIVQLYLWKSCQAASAEQRAPQRRGLCRLAARRGAREIQLALQSLAPGLVLVADIRDLQRLSILDRLA